MTARSLSHPPPRNTSRTAQKTRHNLQKSIHISAKDGADNNKTLAQTGRATTQLQQPSGKIKFL